MSSYRQRLAERQRTHDRLDAVHARLAWTRLALVFVAVAMILFARSLLGPAWLLAPLAAFVAIAFKHGKVLNERDRARRACEFYRRGLARLSGTWQGTGDRGERFRSADHLYAEDLDLFGAGGLFELLVTARTRLGEDVLASWLLSPAPPFVVLQRQAAITELAPKLDLQEDMAVVGPELAHVVRTHDLESWARQPDLLRRWWPRVVLPVTSVASAAMLGWWMWTGERPNALWPMLIVQGLIAFRFRRAVEHVTHGIEQRERELEALASVMTRIQGEPADAPLLKAVRDRLRFTGRAPDDEIRRLARMVDFIGSAHNPFFAIISAALALGTQLAFAVEAWRSRCGPAVAEWLAAVAEYEALAALATYTAEHPADRFPEFLSGAATLQAEALAHPLLAEDAVANDVALGGQSPQLLLVSGSNMSGKSTLLRTLGINVVLAHAGAPVRAARLRLTPLHVGATLRIQDSLQAGRSRFFAEITRLSEIVSLAARSTSVPTASTSVPTASTSVPATTATESDAGWGTLFLLDELLAGTNSHDRLEGARGILEGLTDRGAIGLATTHDLALTAMVAKLGDRAANVQFDDRFVDDALVFDYQLKPGVVQTSNAIALMRAVGLRV